MSWRSWITPPNVELTLCAPTKLHKLEALDGIIDTGASVICADSRVALRLGLAASNRKMVMMADGREVLCSIYTMQMAIPALGFENLVQVYGIEMKYPSSRVLLGRAFLSNYIMNYDGPKEVFTFHETDRGAEFYGADHDE